MDPQKPLAIVATRLISHIANINVDNVGLCLALNFSLNIADHFSPIKSYKYELYPDRGRCTLYADHYIHFFRQLYPPSSLNET